MTTKLARLLFLLAAPLLLASCLTPGRFTSRLEIGRDRSFTFTYVGEAVVTDPGSAIQITSGEGTDVEQESRPPQELSEADRQRVMAALAREVGYRSVEYVGENKFRIDYAISGRLDRSFVFPMNPDGMAIIPWVVVQVRRDGTAQVNAGAFGDSDGSPGNAAPPGGDANRHRRGTFTLVTDADLVRHNSEQRATPGGRSTLNWEVTPEPRPAPTALLRFAG
ncbi:MAG: hypothetical protein M3177_09350 [Pseudomonadota bacterium]|nr:hypothetical protein [Pseudomonadota bacterium]